MWDQHKVVWNCELKENNTWFSGLLPDKVQYFVFICIHSPYQRYTYPRRIGSVTAAKGGSWKYRLGEVSSDFWFWKKKKKNLKTVQHFHYFTFIFTDFTGNISCKISVEDSGCNIRNVEKFKVVLPLQWKQSFGQTLFVNILQSATRGCKSRAKAVQEWCVKLSV